jgi:alpha-glucosidase (family GH31 glycosyl hydrolase)
MFRVHGSATNDATEPSQKDNPGKEIWQFPPETQKILIDYDKLRYHLLPYIYSVSWAVTHDNSTMMRGLVMDFRNDRQVYNIPDQYLFGPAVMVNPVTQAGATTRKVEGRVGTRGNRLGLVGSYRQNRLFQAEEAPVLIGSEGGRLFTVEQ